MDVYEITGFKSGLDRAGVNFLDPSDSFDVLNNGYIYRQLLYSRKGFSKFGNRLSDNSRVMGIFENVLVDGSTQLLVCSKDFLYKYNSSTNQFDQIPNINNAPAGGFGIGSNAAYVSGTTYLTASGGNRFVFTGFGMKDIYYYDGSNVQSFTLDNADYQAPALGALTKATRIIWFGERLNLFVPVIGGVTYNQGILYSGIRTTSGNGDKFNVSGAGLIQADTYENMQGISRLGDVVVMNFQSSNWALEKTRDAFNPYFSRKIPSVLGTDAGFSAVNWNYEVKSVGQTGLITTDSRRSDRFDNKIPYFTADRIDPINIDLTYGGFDRINGQFLFSYRSSQATIASTQDKVLSYNYEEGTFGVNDQRFSCFGQTIDGQNLTWNDIEAANNPSWASWDTTEEIWDKIGIGKKVQKTLAGDNLGFVYEINTDYDDYFVSISNITQATQAVLTVSESAFQVGDKVVVTGITSGMTEINDKITTVVSATTTSITLDLNSTSYTAYSTGGYVSKLIEFEAKTIPFNPYRDKGMRFYISHLEFLVNKTGGEFTVDAIEDYEDSPFLSVTMTPDTELTSQVQWLSMIVNQEANFISFIIKQESYSTQLSISSIRIHGTQGGLLAP